MFPAASDNYQLTFARRLSSALSYAVFVLGLWGLIGWKFVAPYLDGKTVKLVVMSPVACVLYMFTGVALWAFQEKRDKRFRLPGAVCGVFVLALSGFSLVNYPLGSNIGLGPAVIRAIGAESAAFVLFEDVITARIGLFLIAAAAMLLLQRQVAWHTVAHIAASVVGMVGLSSLIGYLYSFSPLYFAIESRWVIGLPSAIALVCASLGALLLRPGIGLVPVFLGSDVSGTAARRFLLLSIAVPFGVGALLAYARRITRIPAEESILLFTVAIILLSFVLVYWNSLALRKVEQKARESEYRLKAVVENLAEGLVAVNPEGTILNWNPAALKIHGYEHHESELDFLSRLPEIFELTTLDGAFIPFDQWPVSRLLRGESFHDYEVYVRNKKQGWQRVFSYNCNFVRSGDGRPLMGLISIRDVTDRKKADETMKATNRELEQFAYVASHDLQEPLRMVASFTELLERRYRDRFDERGRKYLRYIIDGAARMQGLIQDLLTFSRIGRLDTERHRTDLNAVVDNVIGDLSEKIDETQARVTHDPLPPLNANESSMSRLFTNLISNAIKFRKKDVPPKVHITAERSGNEWRFAVRDNGIGIDPKYFGKLFVIFQRLHGREEYPGTGMGLAICKKIVDNYGGRIWVESRPGKGATFYFSIPQ